MDVYKNIYVILIYVREFLKKINTFLLYKFFFFY